MDGWIDRLYIYSLIMFNTHRHTKSTPTQRVLYHIWILRDSCQQSVYRRLMDLKCIHEPTQTNKERRQSDSTARDCSKKLSGILLKTSLDLIPLVHSSFPNFGGSMMFHHHFQTTFWWLHHHFGWPNHTGFLLYKSQLLMDNPWSLMVKSPSRMAKMLNPDLNPGIIALARSCLLRPREIKGPL